jgi:hypothetical protein
VELFLNASDLLARHVALLSIHFQSRRTGQPSMSAVHNRGHHLQIAQQFGAYGGGGFHFQPLRFEKQLRLIEDAFADRWRPLAPGGI